MKTHATTMKLFSTIVGSLIVTLCHLATVADEVKVPVGQQSSYNAAIERPDSGMSKTEVQQRYGEPEQTTDAVGEPPISSWEYGDYIVYFEYDRVIHSVLK